jgi:uncharacterized protein with PIN domain
MILLRVHDVELAAMPDPVILAWAAGEGRILLTHNRDTVPNFAYDCVRVGEPMPGVFLVSDHMQLGQAIEELYLAIQCLTPEDCKDQVHSVHQRLAVFLARFKDEVCATDDKRIECPDCFHRFVRVRQPMQDITHRG